MADSEKLNYVATDEMNAGLSFDSNDSVMDKLQGLKNRISVLNDNYQNFTAATKQGLARIKSIITDKMKDHLSGIMDGKIGNLAKEIAEEASKDLGLDTENMNEESQQAFLNVLAENDLIQPLNN